MKKEVLSAIPDVEGEKGAMIEFTPEEFDEIMVYTASSGAETVQEAIMSAIRKCAE